MNTEQLRQSLKARWLNYYEENREWLTRLGVWVDCEGERRPSSGFILATLSVLEPNLTHLLPLIVDLSNNPDRIVMALGLNFNPDKLLEAQAKKVEADRRMLPAGESGSASIPPQERVKVYSEMDEACQGAQGGEGTSDRPPRRRYRDR
ncbi:MAG TPA: hypothetical protein IGS53_13140 [Leptolyngbyaceae cyanobacterium M33_DOE_097]|nr:hypothetical protein [Leptolyngbyaceae cyanobacterium M33_DOE_097]